VDVQWDNVLYLCTFETKLQMSGLEEGEEEEDDDDTLPILTVPTLTTDFT